MSTTTYRGYRVCGDVCPPHSVEHYSGGDTIVREALRSGEQLLWRAWGPDDCGRTTVAVHGTGAAWMSEAEAQRAVDRAVTPGR